VVLLTTFAIIIRYLLLKFQGRLKYYYFVNIGWVTSVKFLQKLKCNFIYFNKILIQVDHLLAI